MIRSRSKMRDKMLINIEKIHGEVNSGLVPWLKKGVTSCAVVGPTVTVSSGQRRIKGGRSANNAGEHRGYLLDWSERP